MLCIVAFAFVLVAAVFSARYRRLVGKAWSCVWRKTTFRPCDSSFRDDVKSRLLAPLAVRRPSLVKPAGTAIEVFAWIMVLTLVFSLYTVGKSGLNLFVYGTCDKEDGQSCSLAAQMCSVDSGTPGFWGSIGQGDVIGAFGNEFSSVGETIAAIPSRLKDWDAADYAASDATYIDGYDAARSDALEILDPGCRFCAQLFRNIEESGFADTHNLTYLPYPITDDTGPRFANSPLIASYLTAVRLYGHPLPAESADWYILEQLFTETAPDGTGWQQWINAASPAEARAQLDIWLGEAGYADADVAAIGALADSDEVAAELARIRAVVEDDVQTLAIPSLIAGGKLHQGLVDTDTLAGID